METTCRYVLLINAKIGCTIVDTLTKRRTLIYHLNKHLFETEWGEYEMPVGVQCQIHEIFSGNFISYEFDEILSFEEFKEKFPEMFV